MPNYPIKAVSERIMRVVIDMVEGTGVTDPSLMEIAAADAKTNGSVRAAYDVYKVEASVRADLGILLNGATGEKQYFVIPLNATYYSKFRGAVTNMDDASKCIAGRGRGAATEGFIFIGSNAPDHPLLKTYYAHLGVKAKGTVMALGIRIGDAIDAGRLTDGGEDTALLPDMRQMNSSSKKVVKELAAQLP